MLSRHKWIIYFILAAFCLSACGGPVAEPQAIVVTPTSQFVNAAPAGTSTAIPLIPTPTLAGTPTPSPTVTFTATPVPDPMTIEALRQRDYPGSEIIIEDELDPGPNYYRYYAYYYSDGLKIYALLTVPYGDRPAEGWPAIVFNHGYIPPDQYRTTERYVAYVDRLAASGYIVFRIDYRGHDRSEGAASGAYGDPGYSIDVLNAVSSLKQHPDVDPDRIGMWGHSMGGFLTLRAMVISPDVKAGVIWGGVVASYPEMIANWRRGDGPTPTPNPEGPRRWRTRFVDEYGTPEENPEFWASISANTFLADLSGPIQLHHAFDDDSVPVEFSQLLYDQILQAGGVTELFTYENDDHNLSQAFSVAMARTIQFFDLYLKMP